MSAPKTETILRYCSTETAVQVLRDHGVMRPDEADLILKRARLSRDRAMDVVYRKETLPDPWDAPTLSYRCRDMKAKPLRGSARVVPAS